MPLFADRKLRFAYAAVAAIAIFVGLIVHYKGALLHKNVRDSIGDALWASMIASAVSAVAARQRPLARYATALSICYAVEFSQLWHTPALDQLRATRFGPLVLGSGFDVRDLLAYAIGILLFAIIDQYLISRSAREP